MGNAQRNRLGGINHAAASHSQHEAQAVFPAEADALIHQGKRGVRLDAAQFLILHAGGFQGSRDGVVKAGTPDAAASVVEEDFFAERLEKGARFMLGSFSENERGLVIVNEIEHGGDAVTVPLTLRLFHPRLKAFVRPVPLPEGRIYCSGGCFFIYRSNSSLFFRS